MDPDNPIINVRSFGEDPARVAELGPPTPGRSVVLSDAQLASLVLPSRTPEGQPAPGLRFGQPRVNALLQGLCLFALAPEGRR